MKTFAERLKFAMAEANLNQSTLSKKSGASKAAISQYLSGKNTPGPDRIKVLADITGTTFDFLMSYTEAPVKDIPVPNKRITVKDAARCLGTSPATVRRLVNSGRLPVRYVGCQPKFLVADLNATFAPIPYDPQTPEGGTK